LRKNIFFQTPNFSKFQKGKVWESINFGRVEVVTDIVHIISQRIVVVFDSFWFYSTSISSQLFGDHVFKVREERFPFLEIDAFPNFTLLELGKIWSLKKNIFAQELLSFAQEFGTIASRHTHCNRRLF
jgi:hypothetical protein